MTKASVLKRPWNLAFYFC